MRDMEELLDELRSLDDGGLIALGNGRYVEDTRHRQLAEDIDIAVGELYLPLPLDADGTPVHFGDEVRVDGVYETTVSGFSYRYTARKPKVMVDGGGTSVEACALTHITPGVAAPAVSRDYYGNTAHTRLDHDHALEACPFCGGAMVLAQTRMPSGSWGGWHVAHRWLDEHTIRCYGQVQSLYISYADPAEAAGAWNRRA